MQIEKWIAHCVTCGGKELERCANGAFAEGAARRHVREHKDHVVIVGYELTAANVECRNCGRPLSACNNDSCMDESKLRPELRPM